jgi:hypothetical protein
MNFSPFIATPVHDARVHGVYMAGALSASHTFQGCDWQLCNGTGLMRQRDALVAAFLAGSCSHLLWVDSDMGWRAEDAQALFDTGEDFIGGTYCRKSPGKPLTAHLLANRKGDLIEATHVGTGFLLVSRIAIERMIEAFAADRYVSAGKEYTSLFSQNIHEGTEDLAFCRKWRELGGQVWMHTGVVLPHYDGNTAYVADVSSLREGLATAAE